jgi:hypothetical protein
MGHEDQFLLSRLNDGCRFREATFAGTYGNGQEAPRAIVRSTTGRRLDCPDARG